MKLRNKKTGEVVVEINKIGLVWNKYGMPAEIGQYDSIAELCEEWEDYVPKEPLIKDEKIRKAVRAWADGNNIESVHYDAFWRGFRRGNSSITVWEELPLEDNKVYTIDELCEEWEDYVPKEPLIKDEKIREAVRAWWECCHEGISDKRVCIINGEFRIGIYRLDLGRHYFFDDKKEGFYTIDELCGTPPEPLEPTFVNLDERVKEKEEE